MQQTVEGSSSFEILRLLTEGTAAATGEQFFRSLARHAAQALHARYAFVAETLSIMESRSLAYWEGSDFGEGFSYRFPGTPCQRVAAGYVCSARTNLQALFPDDLFLQQIGADSYLGVPMKNAAGKVLGHIAVLHTEPMQPSPEDIAVLTIFASRACAELERTQAERALHEAMSEVQRLKDRLQAENVYLQDEIRTVHNFEEMVGNDPVLLELLQKIPPVAVSDAAVLIQGETGTGKELIARALHSQGPRRDRPLVKVNCGAISAGLVESELFGHVKGAFTGALARRVGRFELATVLAGSAAHAAVFELTPFERTPIDRSTDTVLLWQGFKHRWTYNHRVNRIGNYIRSQSCAETGACSATFGHTAASGSGTDRASYASFYAQVSAPNTRFLTGSTYLEVHGEEGTLLTNSATLHVPAPPSMQGRGARVLLNGFDLVAIPSSSEPADADKVEDFDLKVTDASYNSARNTLDFTIGFSFKGACRSAECEYVDTKLDYGITVQYVIVSAPDTEMVGFPAGALVFEVGPYDWNDSTEITSDSVDAQQTQNIDIGAAPDFATAVAGIKRIKLNMDREHYLLEWNNYLSTSSYDPESGLMQLFDELFFKQWRPAMFDEYGEGALAGRDEGQATLRMHIVALKFHDACARQGLPPRTGSFEYPANAGNNAPQAKQESILTYTTSEVCAPQVTISGPTFGLVAQGETHVRRLTAITTNLPNVQFAWTASNATVRNPTSRTAEVEYDISDLEPGEGVSSQVTVTATDEDGLTATAALNTRVEIIDPALIDTGGAPDEGFGDVPVFEQP